MGASTSQVPINGRGFDDGMLRGAQRKVSKYL